MKLSHTVFYTIDNSFIEWYEDYKLNYDLAIWDAKCQGAVIVYSKSVYETDNGTKVIKVYRNTNHDVITKEVAEAMLFILR